jgi:hypothetical protein
MRGYISSSNKHISLVMLFINLKVCSIDSKTVIIFLVSIIALGIRMLRSLFRLVSF